MSTKKSEILKRELLKLKKAKSKLADQEISSIYEYFDELSDVLKIKDKSELDLKSKSLVSRSEDSDRLYKKFNSLLDSAINDIEDKLDDN